MSNESETPQQGEEFEAEVARVARDWGERSLAEAGGYFARLIEVASLRDYNTGCYHHYGLETRYPEDAVDEALRRCHQRILEDLVALPLKDQTDDLLAFFESLKEDPARLVSAWQRLRSYQILPPEECHPLARELFVKNVEIILRVLRETELWPLLHEPHGHADHLP